MRHNSTQVIAIAAVAGIAWLLNVIWEFAQMPLYSAASNAPGHEWMCLRASVFDAIFSTTLYLILAASHRSLTWLVRWNSTDKARIVIVGLAMAFVIEQRALADGRWSYGPAMPLVLGVGLTPLIQLALLTLTTFALVRTWMQRASLASEG